jgi:hypothetical protein
MKEKIKKILRWLYWNAPIITTMKIQDEFTYACMSRLENQISLHRKAVANAAIYFLKELRNNTWDVERVDQAINWLKDNFEVK